MTSSLFFPTPHRLHRIARQIDQHLLNLDYLGRHMSIRNNQASVELIDMDMLRLQLNVS